MILPLHKKHQITPRNTHLRTVITDAPHGRSWFPIVNVRRWGAICACSALLAGTVSAAETPFEKSAHQPASADGLHAAPFPEEISESGAPNSGIVPLDLPLSDFGRGRVSPVEARIQTPAIVKSVPSPYFETTKQAPPALKPLMTLTDFLAAVPPAEPVVEKIIAPSLLPPEPSTDVTQPIAPMAEDDVPGMDDTVFRPISQIQPYYAYSPTGKHSSEYLCPQPSSTPDQERARCPEIQELPSRGSTQRHFALVDYQWCATNLHHKPLYFEDVALERYGQKYPCGLQPFVSVAKFGVQGIGLPYQMAIDPVWRDIYSLGYYRPGDHAPELIYQVPFNMKAAAAAGGVYTGLIFLVP